MKRPFIPGLDPFDIVLGDCTAAELRQAVDAWRIRNPERTDVHIKRGKCDDCDGTHLRGYKAPRTIKL
jgi:hypothetical protein